MSAMPSPRCLGEEIRSSLREKMVSLFHLCRECSAQENNGAFQQQHINSSNFRIIRLLHPKLEVSIQASSSNTGGGAAVESLTKRRLIDLEWDTTGAKCCQPKFSTKNLGWQAQNSVITNFDVLCSSGVSSRRGGDSADDFANCDSWILLVLKTLDA